ncbi:MAG: SHOCT domain-containing protein [Planctomycetota bacterium]|jgi:uncharacterized membrane protein
MPTYWYSACGWWICPLFMIAFIIICVFAARRENKAFCCSPFRRWSTKGSILSESPKDILDKRYAAGDITRQEYEEKLRDIQGL